MSACVASHRAGVHNTFAFPVAPDAWSAIGPVCERLTGAGVRVCTFPVVTWAPHYGRRWGLSPSLAAWIMRHVRQYDVVHIHGTWGLVQLVALLAAKHASRPSVVTPHESLTSYDVGHTRPAAKRRLKQVYLDHGSLFVLSSRLEADDTLPISYSHRGTVIPHPLPQIEAGLGVADSPVARPLVIGFLGRLHDKKNVHLLIRAIALSSCDARLRIAGDGPPDYKAALMSVVSEFGVEDRVEWLGFVAREDRNDFLDSIDVLAMPSRYECFGMSAAEAIARGVAVVVSSKSGIADLVQRYSCGIVARPTVHSLAEIFQVLDANRDLVADLAQRGTTAALAELSMTSYGARIRSEYETLLGR